MADETNNTQTPPPPAAPAFDTLIPEEFKDRQYLSDIKTLPVGPDGYKALFKKLDGAQTLLGKKTGIPAPDAPPEEMEKFYSSLRPAKADEYEMPAPKEGAPAQDPEFAKAVKGMFHDAGLSKTQATKLMSKFDAFVAEKMGTKAAEDAKLDTEFEELTKQTFGAENEKVLSRSKELLATLTPANMAPMLNRLPNESLVLLAGIMESVRAKFMKEDSMDGSGGTGQTTDVSALREEARKLMASASYKDFRDKDHGKTLARVDEIYGAIGRAAGGAKK